jgi:hypothetical protein
LLTFSHGCPSLFNDLNTITNHLKQVHIWIKMFNLSFRTSCWLMFVTSMCKASSNEYLLAPSGLSVSSPPTSIASSGMSSKTRSDSITCSGSSQLGVHLT